MVCINIWRDTGNAVDWPDRIFDSEDYGTHYVHFTFHEML